MSQNNVPLKEQTLQEKAVQLRGIIACGHNALNRLLDVPSTAEDEVGPGEMGVRIVVDCSIAEAQNLLDRLEALVLTTGVL
ncbi:MAG: hypothetical protein Q7O66_13760 [Dehalococcoidia bacterium]|nr:hypothetical protein [Dehalococcoidia bacterium]